MEAKELNLGVIGLSEGNGHPYSWSAIINGDYDTDLMQECGYDVIPEYLGANRDTLGIDYASVTHVWTQDRALSEHVARASHIETVVDRAEDMIGKVDAVLLARDDPENHVAMAKPFIEADVPIFIDKPLAFSRSDLDWFSEQVQAGKFIMSSSALRYSAGVQTHRAAVSKLGPLQLAIAVGQKDLRKYAIHQLEGMVSLLGDPTIVSARHVSRKSGKDILYFEFETGLLGMVSVFKNIAGSELNVYGEQGMLSVSHGGAYPSFRTHIVETIHAFRTGKPRLSFDKTWNVIAALCAARESLENGGRQVDIRR